MRDKVRRIDFSPDEFLVGVNGMRPELIGVYWVVCSLIYSRGEAVDNDPKWIGRASGCRKPSHCRGLLDELIARGKLTVNADGKLENGRAMVELDYALSRVGNARKGGEAKAKRHRNGTVTSSKRHPSGSVLDPVSAEINDLAATQPSTINHQPSKKESETLSSESVRARARKSRSGTVNGGQHVEARERLPEGWVPSEDQCGYARSLGLEPQHVADAFVLWWVEGKGRNERRSERGWNLTWQGWCRRDAERGSNRSGAASPRAAKGGGDLDAFARGLARVVDAERNRK